MNKNERFKSFMDITKETNEAYHRAAQHFGLSDSTFDILYFLDTEGSLTQKELSVLMYSSKQTVHSAVQSMIQKGLVYFDGVRGREKTLALTEEGLKLAHETTHHVYLAEQKAFNSFSTADQIQIIALSTQFVRKLNEEIENLK